MVFGWYSKDNKSMKNFQQGNNMIKCECVSVVVTRRERSGRMKREKRIKYMMMEGDLTLGSEHAMQYTDDVSQNCTPKIYIILLTDVTPIHLIK